MTPWIDALEPLAAPAGLLALIAVAKALGVRPSDVRAYLSAIRPAGRDRTAGGPADGDGGGR